MTCSRLTSCLLATPSEFSVICFTGKLPTQRLYTCCFYKRAQNPFKKKKKKTKNLLLDEHILYFLIKMWGQSQTLVLVGDIKRVCCTKEMFEVDSIGQMKTWGTVSAVGCSNIWDSGNLCLFCARRLWNIVTHMHTDSQYPHRSVVRIDSSNYCSVTSGPC